MKSISNTTKPAKLWSTNRASAFQFPFFLSSIVPVGALKSFGFNMKSLFSVLAVFLTACATTPVQQAVVGRAQAISRFPVKRSILIKDLGLESIESERIDGGVRGGCLSYSESWRFPSGLTVTAFDSEYVGNQSIVRRTIDRKDFSAQTSSVTLNGLPPVPLMPQPRQSFDQVVITTKAGRELFRSDQR